jgi:hypothetical protein
VARLLLLLAGVALLVWLRRASDAKYPDGSLSPQPPVRLTWDARTGRYLWDGEAAP